MNRIQANAVTILNKAGDLVEAGWVQGKLGSDIDGKRCYCAIGAVREARILVSRGDGYAVAIKRLAELPAVSRFNTIAQWNDDPQRTQAEVVEALRTAAKQVTREQSR